MGGAEYLLLNLCSYQRSNGNEVTVVPLRKNGDLEKKFSKNKINISSLEYNRSSKNIFILFDLIKLIFKLSPNIIHTHLFPASRWGRLAGIFAGIPVINTEHGSVRSYNILNRISMKILSYYTRSTMNISQSDYKYYTRYFFNSCNSRIQRSCVIPNCIDISRFKSPGISKTISNDHIKIVSVGNLSYNKGKEYLIRAAKILCISGINNFTISLVGDGPLRPHLVDLAKSMNVDTNVIFVGKSDNIEQHLADADIYIQPSIHEGFGIVILEAMYKKIPVIASDVEGISEIITDKVNGLLIKPKSPDNIYEAIKYLLNNEISKTKMTENAYNDVIKKYMPEVYHNQINNLYSNILRVT